MRYIYSDESMFPESGEYVATGMLISDAEIESELIQRGIQSLKQDPDRHDLKFKTKDDRTLLRGYFHASEDSPNAHSHLCDAINSGINGAFKSHYFKRGAMKSDEQTDEHILHLSSMLSALSGFETRDEITFIFEQRTGLNSRILEAWHQALELQVAMAIYNQPGIPAFFPACRFLIGGKDIPGLQCTDFLLWIANRHKQGDSTWYMRIQSKIKISFAMQETGREGGVDLPINAGIVSPAVHYTIGDCPKDGEFTRDEFAGIPFTALKSLRNYAIDGLPAHLLHQEASLKEVYSNRINPDYPDFVEKLAFTFIRLFDSAPLIDAKTSADEKRELLYIKKMMSLVLDGSQVSGARTRNHFTQVWHSVIRDQPELLG